MPGPPPKDPSVRRRRNATPGFRQLPAEGRAGLAPGWPLATLEAGESALWAQLWSLPQAVEWERIHCERAVAMFVRMSLAAEAAPTDTKLSAEVRQLDAAIGLSPKAMAQLRWEVADPAADPEPAPVADAAQEEDEEPFIPRSN